MSAGRNRLASTLVAIAALAMSACAPPEPVRLGFIGGLTGRVADLGIAGRNGVALAVEMRNQAGGVNGRPVEMIVEDDKQDVEAAKAATGRLIARKVDAIVGPMTSSIAMAIVPLANEAKVVVMSPTVTTTALSGIDDHFLRVAASTSEYAAKVAANHYGVQGKRRVAAIYDLSNKAYTEGWLVDYRRVFEQAGGSVVASITFTSGKDVNAGELADSALKAKPDMILLLANSVDAALLAQQVRRRDPAISMSSSEWAATERLLELGGKDIEGMIVAQFLDRDSTSPAYQSFRKTFRERFGQEPGFGGLAAFDAANVVFDGLARRKSGQSLKESLLTSGSFPGAQNEIRFSPSGDTSRPTYLSVVRNGAFVRLD